MLGLLDFQIFGLCPFKKGFLLFLFLLRGCLVHPVQYSMHQFLLVYLLPWQL